PSRVRGVPPASPRPPFFAHARLRRTSPIAQYSVAAALEASQAASANLPRAGRLGVIVSVMSACVTYSRRFYDEALKDPATASPLVFPETVFNAPASHIAALLGSTGINYTLVGDPGTFLCALALASDWLVNQRVDGCVVVGAEESDWVTAEASAIFDRNIIMGEGAGALFLRRAAPDAEVLLSAVTEPVLYTRSRSRADALRQAREQLRASRNGHSVSLLCDSTQGVPRQDRPGLDTWSDWTGRRMSVKKIFGEGLMAAAAWQTLAGVAALRRGECDSAIVSISGVNQQAVMAKFIQGSRPVPKSPAAMPPTSTT
ncbi:MAG TPA: beta-ketoacyl synthase N-terminal-like domain-containing protein, partial [Verrucomicrobiae bacterium]|nr:beta-ketoacyl synthase N-terminal-like domain-containing protein [Verrucomicrobiae bacterium]